MRPFYVSKLTLLITILVGWSMCASAQVSVYNWNGSAPGTGSVQTYTVAAGVTMLGIDAIGPCGGGAYNAPGSPGPVALGGRVQCVLAVTPGQTLYIYVGGLGQSDMSCTTAIGGFNGGINGGCFGAAAGGATDIRLSAGSVTSSVPYQVTPYTSGNRIIVAGGGGGGGDFNGAGGKGGGLTGGTGSVSTLGGTGGSGGTQSGPGPTGATMGSLGVGGSLTSYDGGGGGYWGGNGGVSFGGGGGGSSYTDPVLCTSVTHTQGYALANGNGKVTITVLCNSPGTIVGSNSVCMGATATYTNPTSIPGGTWSTSDATVATINSSTGALTPVGTGTVTLTYSITNPCGSFATMVVTINPSPTSITGTPNMCSTFTTALASTPSGGTWSSSNTTVAAAAPSTGVITGLSTGFATITYTLPGGCYNTAPVTVNQNPAAITGTTLICGTGQTTTLTETTTGGTWASSFIPVASVGGVLGNNATIVGGVPGIATISYTMPTGCIATKSVSVSNLVQFNVTGGGAYCNGSSSPYHIGLSGSSTGINYQLYSGAVTVGPFIAGTGGPLDFGVISAAGTYTVKATDAVTGCNTMMTGSATIIVNPIPNPFTMSTPGNVTSYCAGGSGIHIILNSSELGVNYTLYKGGVATATVLGGTSGSLDFGAQTPGVYTIVGKNASTLCTNNMTGSITINTNPLPSVYTVTGGGGFCDGDAGVHITLSYSNVGVNYTLYNGPTAVVSDVPGSNSGLDFGLISAPGTYTVKAYNALTTCSVAMTGSATVNVNPLPDVHNVSASNFGIYCVGGSGVHVTLDGSNTGVSYQVYNGGSPVGGPVSGTNASLDFGLFTTGTYTIVGTNTVTGCQSDMAGSAIVNTTPLPTIYLLSVSGGGHFCAGGTGSDITLLGSDYGIGYQLYRDGTPVGVLHLGDAGIIDFGFFTIPGTYTVLATDQTYGCTSVTAGVSIYIDALPGVYNVVGGGSYCPGEPGKHVGLSFSDVGVNYELWYSGTTPIASATGTGSGIDFGIYSTPGFYTVVATNATTGCTSNMSGSAVITANSAPNNSYTILPVTGSYCAGGTGVDVTTSGSDIGINYQLYNGTTTVGSPIPGTGDGESIVGNLDFGNQLAPGIYTIVATDASSGCTSTLTGNTTITINPLPTVYNVSGGGNYCAGTGGVHVTLSGSDSGISYQLYNGLSTVGDPVFTLGGGPIDFGVLTDGGTYTVVATNPATSCTSNMAGSGTINILPLPTVFNVTGGGNYCAGGTGVLVGLDGSQTGPNIRYQLYNTGVASGPALTGTGLSLNFGLHTDAGNYTVIATNILTTCSSQMSGSQDIVVNPLPNNSYVVSGGGVFCAGGDGLHINLSGSDEGTNYQLYRGTTAIGDPVSGGGALDFGSQTAAGTYTVSGTNTNGCTSNMTGSATITVNTPTVYTVLGGGAFCSGGTGVHIGLSGSSAGTSYQVYFGVLPYGDPVNGTGAALDFGSFTSAGTYTVTSMDTTFGCPGTMSGSATVMVNSLPNPYAVTGGGRFCEGGAGDHIGLAGSDESTSYQLYNGGTAVGLPITSSGGALDFGLQTAGGTYTVIATNPSTGCVNNMIESAVITVYPLPVPYAVTADNYGNYCAADSGLHVRLPNSQTGVKYQLYRDGTPVGGYILGNGGPLDLGIQVIAGAYTVYGTDTGTTCAQNMSGTANIYIIPLPLVYNVTGGGDYCPGGAGIHVGLAHSQAGIYYQLYRGTTAVDTPLYGTGVSLDFGLQTAGVYTIVGNSAITTCPNDMLGSATVVQDTLMLPSITIKAYPGLGVGVWHIDSLQVLFTNGGIDPTFQWIINGHNITGATSATFTHHEFFNGDSITVNVTASGPCGGLTATRSMVLHLFDVGVKQVTSAGSDLKLIPNPNKGDFSIKGTLGTTDDEEVNLEVTNMIGQAVYTGKVMTHNGQIDQRVQLSSSLANGTYNLTVRSASQNNVIHFVVEQ